MITDQQKNIIIEVLNPFCPKSIGIFGSYARNENNDKSDLDILVEFEKRVNLIDVIGAEIELSERLGLKVDIITKKSVPLRLKPLIEKDLQSILNG